MNADMVTMDDFTSHVRNKMEHLFQTSIHWPEGSVMRINTVDGHEMTLHVPILKHRWPLFAENREAALEIAQSLTKEQLQAILLFTYSDLPAKRSMEAIFQQCQLKHPQSLQNSTFVEDMRQLMGDHETADFKLVSCDGEFVHAHRVILAARSRYFRALLLSGSRETVHGEWRHARPLSLRTLQFFIEYVYTGQIYEPSTIELIPLAWLVKYLRLSGDREVENIILSALSRELNRSTEPEGQALEKYDRLYKAAQEWGAKCVIDVIDKYRATMTPQPA